MLEKKQATINTDRNALLVEEQAFDNQTITHTPASIDAETGRGDPFAHIFWVQLESGE